MWTILQRLGMLGVVLGALAALPAVGGEQPFDRNARPGEPPPVPSQEDELPAVQPQVLGRGPVHEGYAQPGGPPRPGTVVPRQPPAPIQEMPPEQKPQGDNVAWVPGYWSWDSDRSDFIWVSGFWRVAPADRKWVPGYWTKGNGGWQWVSGFWASANQPEVPYVEDPPPASLDNGPSVPPPDDDYQYAPGNWMYRDDRYVWSPGFWYQCRSGYLWTPARWTWTPNGYLCVPGYWDYPLEDRGVLFAPCWIPPALCARRGWSFCPSWTVGVPALLASLWVRPANGCYAFGDFYAGRYDRLGYLPWLTYGPRYRDPLYGYYNWRAGGNLAWRRSLVSIYNGRVGGQLALPPRTLAAQRQLAARGRALPGSLNVLQPLGSFSSGRLRMGRLSATERSAMARFGQNVNRASVERRALETRRSGRALSLNRVPTHPGFRDRSSAAVRTLPRTSPGNAPRTLPRVTTGNRLPQINTPSRALANPPHPGNASPANSRAWTNRPQRVTRAQPWTSRPSTNHTTPQRPFRSLNAAPRYQSAPRSSPRVTTPSRSAPAPHFSAPRSSPAPRMSAPRSHSGSAPHSAPHGGGGKKGKH
jgi:hypothetical protein